MNSVVVDNSIILSWGLQDEGCRYADALLETIGEWEAIVPSIWPLELTNGLLMAERRKRINPSDVAHFFSILENMPIHLEPQTMTTTMHEILPLARMHGLTTYDASYLDLAMRMGLPIATLDKALRKAARKAKVPLFKP